MIQVATALALGFLGSLHCLGMCGPLVMAMPLQAESKFITLSNTLLYHSTRITAYAILGLLPGIIGEGLLMTSTQKWLSTVLGIIFITAAILSFRSQLVIKIPGLDKVNMLLQNLFSKWLNRTGLVQIGTMGFLNGLIPCGMVYMAMAAALGSSGVLGSMSFMVMFGIGTLPIFLALALFQHLDLFHLRQNLTKLIPISLGIIGLLFLWRGLFVEVPLNLGILRSMGWDTLCH